MLAYKLRLRSNARTKDAFQKYVFRKVKEHAHTSLVWRDSWLNKESTVTMCFFTRSSQNGSYFLIAVAHGYWNAESDGASRGKVLVYSVEPLFWR